MAAALDAPLLTLPDDLPANMRRACAADAGDSRLQVGSASGDASVRLVLQRGVDEVALRRRIEGSTRKGASHEPAGRSVHTVEAVTDTPAVRLVERLRGQLPWQQEKTSALRTLVLTTYFW